MFMTFSIVARDPDTGEIGVAVQSKAFSVGTLCAFAKAGVGAVATQSLVNVSLGPLGLQLMEEGRSPEQALEYMREVDQGIEYRQLGVLSHTGETMSFSGTHCLLEVGNHAETNLAVQGNLLRSSKVVPAMVNAYHTSSGPLPYRLLQALEAGQQVGGDARGRQSAAIIIEQEGAGRGGFESRKLDLRVEDHESPIAELQRIYQIVMEQEQLQQLLQQYAQDETTSQEIEVFIQNMQSKADEAWLAFAGQLFAKDLKEEAKNALNICLSINPDMLSIILQYPKLGGFSEDFLTFLKKS